MIKINSQTWVEISKEVIKKNIRIIKNLAGKRILMGVVKSNAYGHGLVETAKIFLKSGVNWLGTSNLEEAEKLREAQINSPILVLGYTPVTLFSLAAHRNIRLTLYDKEFFKARSRFKKDPLFHLKVDTGMSRQGVLLDDLPNFLQTAQDFGKFAMEGVYTHFANADNLSDKHFAQEQLFNFQKALNIIKNHGFTPKIIHAAATPAFLNFPETAFDMVRIGIAFYGLWPSLEFLKYFEHLGLKPPLVWKTKVVQVKKISRGASVGYGASEKVKIRSTIAVLPVGYYDGFFRGLSSVGEVLINGQRCKILGKVSMNLCVVDVSKVSGVAVGDEVVLIGRMGQNKITAEEVAQKLGTISYEVVSRINPLLPRIYR